MSNLVDRYLLFRIRTKRDPEAFARIYDRYVEALYRFAFLKLPSKEEAEDITAEAFTKAWNYLQEHHEVAHLKALLYQITRNLIVDYYRNRPEARGIEFVGVTFELDSTSKLMQPDSIAISEKGFSDRGRERELIEARAELSLVVHKLDKLKDDYRDVLTLRLVDGLAFGDIAAILEKPSGTVRVIYHRALKALKDSNQ